MKKRLIAVLLIIVVAATCLTVFVGCAGSKNFKIGVLHINPKDSTSGYTYAHQQGIEEMMETLGIKNSQVIIKDSIDDGNPAAINAAIEELVAAGCKMIIGTSFGYMEEIQAAAKQYPEIIFSHGTGYLDTFAEGENQNMNNYFGRIYQARYLSGIVAGKKASTGGKIGYVAAFGTSIAECSSGVNAFALGVQSVNPTATVTVMTLNSWYDPTNETAYAKALVDLGCEVIAQHCDTENPPTVAKDNEKYSIGYNSDMKEAINDDSCLTSVIWNWGVYYTQAVREAMKCFDEEGNFVSTDAWKAFGNYYGSYEDGLFDLAPLSSEVDADTAAILDLVKAEMKKGTTEWDVFTNTALSFTKDGETWTMAKIERQLKDNAGNNINNVTVADITGSMPYWVAGVSENTAN